VSPVDASDLEVIDVKRRVDRRRTHETSQCNSRNSFPHREVGKHLGTPPRAVTVSVYFLGVSCPGRFDLDVNPAAGRHRGQQLIAGHDPAGAVKGDAGANAGRILLLIAPTR